MHRFLAVISLVSVLFLMGPAKAGPAEDAAAVRAQWELVYNSGDADKFSALYTKDALLFGSTAQLFTGTDGVRTYFSKLPPRWAISKQSQPGRTSCSARGLPISSSRMAPCCPSA